MKQGRERDKREQNRERSKDWKEAAAASISYFPSRPSSAFLGPFGYVPANLLAQIRIDPFLLKQFTHPR